jgi:diguanylate cyclase (GGDEF)-like protein
LFPLRVETTQAHAQREERPLGLLVRLNHVLTGLIVVVAAHDDAVPIWAALTGIIFAAYGVYVYCLSRQKPTANVGAASLAVSVSFLVYINVLFYLTNTTGLVGEAWRGGPGILLMLLELLYVARFLGFRHLLVVSGTAFTLAYLRVYFAVQSTYGMPNELLVTIMRSPRVWTLVLEVWAMIPVIIFVVSEYYNTKIKAETDGLTGLRNHRSFYEHLEQLVHSAQLENDTVALVLLDIDHFKLYNDNNGHQQGDRVLQSVAGILEAGIRKADQVFRYGGEEFAILLPHSNLSEAKVLADRMRRLIATHAFPGEASQPSGGLTVSAGVAAFPESAVREEDLVEAADKALYEAKNTARNTVYLASGVASNGHPSTRGGVLDEETIS